MRGLENLVRNALQHATQMVVVRALSVDGSVRFEVLDDGPGLPQEEGKVDFDSLSTQRSRADSAGLGLKVVRKVAEAHGGGFGAENRPQGGARMWFSIPVREEPEGTTDD